MSEVIEFQRRRVARLDERIEALAEAASAEDAELLAELRAQADAERALLDRWETLASAPPAPVVPPPGPSDHLNAVIGGSAGAAKYEKDWRIVFDYFPGMRSRFQEIVVLDGREDELFRDRHDPELRPVWRDTLARVQTLWDHFKRDVTSRLELLGTPRRFELVLSGHVHDSDWPDADDTSDYDESRESTLRFGEMVPVTLDERADEVRITAHLQCRLAVGAADTVLMEVTGTIDLYESGDREATREIAERLSPGVESAVYRLKGEDEDDYATLKMRFDFKS